MAKDRFIKCFGRERCQKCDYRPRAVSVLNSGRVISTMIGCRDARHVITFKKVIKRLKA